MSARTRLAVVGVLAALGLAACSSVPRPVAVQELGNGFRVPPGATLVGAVVPTIIPTPAESGGEYLHWSALVRFDTEPVAMYRAVAKRASELGLHGFAPAAGACKDVSAPPSGEQHTSTTTLIPRPGTVDGISRARDVRCEGDGAGDRSRRIHVTIDRCRSCRPTTAYGTLEYTAMTGRDVPVRVLPNVMPASNDGRRPPWPVLVGTRALGAAEGECQAGRLTVLEVTGSPDRVWHEYRVRARGVMHSYEASIGGHRVRQFRGGEFGYDEMVTLIEGRGLARPIVAVEAC